MKRSRYQELKLRIEKWRRDGLCIRCGKLPIPNKSHCKKCNEHFKKWRKLSREKLIQENKCEECKSPLDRIGRVCNKCREINKKSCTMTRTSLKDMAFNAYGGYRCICCHETYPDFLTLDHINNDGNKHRREIGIGGGHQWYRWLRDNNYPPILQVLCANCQLGKLRNKGVCSHQIVMPIDISLYKVDSDVR